MNKWCCVLLLLLKADCQIIAYSMLHTYTIYCNVVFCLKGLKCDLSRRQTNVKYRSILLYHFYQLIFRGTWVAQNVIRNWPISTLLSINLFVCFLLLSWLSLYPIRVSTDLQSLGKSRNYVVQGKSGNFVDDQGKWCVSSKFHGSCFSVLSKKNENTHSLHLITK